MTRPLSILVRMIRTYGPAIDPVFADEGSGTGNQVLWNLSDSQNTVRDVAKYTTVTTGGTAKIRNHLEYDSFGNVTSVDDPTTAANTSDGDLPGLQGSGTVNQFSPQRSYTGREPDAATGLIYYRARWFDPQLGRFISEDPIGFAAGDANLSRYVGNSTPNAVDPSGLEEQSFFRGMVDAAAAPYVHVYAYYQRLKQRAQQAAGIAIAQKSQAWINHEIMGGKHRVGGMYGEPEGVAEAAFEAISIGDRETLGKDLQKSVVGIGGFILEQEEMAAQLSHAIGDSCLQQHGQRLKSNLREQTLGDLLNDELVNIDLEAGNSVGRDKFNMTAAAVSSIVVEPFIAAKLAQAGQWLRSTSLFRKIVAMPGGRYLDDGLRCLVKTTDAPKGGTIDFADLATTGDSLYGKGRLDKLKSYLERRGIKLRLDDPRLPANKGGGFIAETGEMLLRPNATKSQVWHELSHYLDFKKLGKEAYMKLPYPLGREQLVYNRLFQSRHWNLMSLWDRALLETKIERLGGTLFE